MKSIKNILIYTMLITLLSMASACNEQEFLEEVPLDFYAAENSYESYSNYQAALTNLYARVRDVHYEGGLLSFSNMLATDIAKAARGSDSRDFGSYEVYMVPTGSIPRDNWQRWYKIISNANTMLSRLGASSMSDAEKVEVEAEARFFRGFAYRNLVYLFGGVPLVLEEVTAPKTDYVRSGKTEILNQIVSDFTAAANGLPTIDQVVDGKVSDIVAQHYLAETYISLGQYDDAITAVSKVIDHASTSLITSRFGSVAGESPGDHHWDLFRVGNQNRSSGNTESLWVIQMEVDVIGGYIESTGGGNHRLERWAGPVHWLTFKDPDGNEGMIRKPQSNLQAGGRGVSFMMNTDYFLDDLWASDFSNDIRNAPHNIVRDAIYDNPESAYFGQSIVDNPSPTDAAQDWRWYPYPSKITTPGQHPDNLFEDKGQLTLKSAAGTTYSDQYMLRLAESYLLRAEAYLGKGDNVNAASDINQVRSRANANPVAPGDVSLDYILDERARELVYEEQRRITLMRTDKLVERVRKYNKMNADDIQDHHKLFPIPFSEIEGNNGAVLEQNPGYTL